jgi:hypothetical protein
MLADRLIPLKDFVAQYPRLGKEATLRRWIREDYKGFSTCAVKAGKQRYLMDLEAVERWLEAQRVTQYEGKAGQ